MDPGINQGFHDEEDVGRTGPAERRRHVQITLVLDVQLLTKRGQDGLRLLALIEADPGCRRPDGDTLADARRGIGHGPHQGRVPQPTGNAPQPRARDDAQHQRIGPHQPAQLWLDVGQHLRLDS